MSFSHWVFAVALGLTVAFGLSEPSQAQGQDRQQPSQQAGTDEAKEGPATGPRATLPVPPTSAEEQKGGSDKPAESFGQNYNILGDTPAQWVMAGVNILALLLSAWAVYLIYATLKATRAAVAEANAGTEAARETVYVTRAIGEAQVQAYLSVIHFEFAVVYRPSGICTG